MQTPRLYKLVFVLCSIFFAVSVAGAPHESSAFGDPMGPIDVNWSQLTLKVNLPHPFYEVTLVIKRNKDNFSPKITAMAIIVHGRKIRFDHELLKGLVMAEDPEISYRPADLKYGKLSSFHIFFKYGFPLRGISACGTPDCFAYHIADFTVDKNYQVKRVNGVLPAR